MTSTTEWCYVCRTDIQCYRLEAIIPVRRSRSRKHNYYQLVRYYRNEEGKPRTEVLVHLGEYETPEAALSAWPEEIAEHRRNDRDERADRLEEKLTKLRELTGEDS